MLPERLVRALARVRTVGVITGAGVSKAAGLRTYRGAGGVYEDPVEGDRTIEALSGPTLRTDPDRTWEAVLRLARKAKGADPGPAHRALVELERRAPGFVLLTQNVDGLHARAGSRDPIEIHGNVFRTRCEECGAVAALPDALLAPRAPRPPCADCRGVLRPDVTLFGEPLPVDELRRLHDRLRARSPDLVMILGTSALFPYIVEPVRLARHRGKVTIEVNPEPTEASDHAEHVLRASAEEVLPEVLGALTGLSGSR